MKTFIKAISFLFGAALIGVVIWLGFLTANNQSAQLVAFFGIASALIAPIGLALIGYVFTTNDLTVINRLAKVPEIEKLIAEADSQEEKIRLLEKQKQQLAEIIQFETRRQFLFNRKESNESEAIRLLYERKAIEDELSSLNITLDENVEIAGELEALRERIDARQHSDIIFTINGMTFRLDAIFFRMIPLSWLFYDTLQLSNKLRDWATPKLRQLVAKRNHEQNSQ